MGRIPPLFIDAGLAGRRVEAQLSSLLEVERLRRRGLWRPRIIFLPDITARLEDISLGERSLFTSLQIFFKERKLNLLAEEDSCLRAEVHIAELVAIPDGPAAMGPRPDYQRVDGTGVELVDCVKGLERSGEILGVEPAADGHHGSVNIFHVQGQV